jgi:Flp pilus assembly protein TadG
MRRRRRTSQTGQAVVITAMMATLILGAMALSVDLSLHTYNQRTLQNVADAAALAGATDLGNTPTTTQEQQGITDALSTIQRNQGWLSTWTGAASAITCTNLASLSGYCETVAYQTYTVKISTPPQTAKAASTRTLNNFEVDIFVNVSNNFGAFVGVPSSTVGAHAVAFNSGPPGPFGYTFFSSTEVDSGNQVESITGDAYVGAGYVGASASKSGLCINEVAGPEPSGDSDGDSPTAQDNDVDDLGHVVFSGPLPPIAHPGVNGDPIYGSGACSNGRIALQTKQDTVANPNCPPSTTPTADSGGRQCVLSPPPVPNIQPPTPNMPAGSIPCGGTVNSATPSGIYPITAGCTVNLSFATGDVQCIDLVLGTGASVNVIDKSAQDYMTDWAFNPATDPTAVAAIAKLTPAVPAPTACGNTDPSLTHAASCVICAQPSTASCTPGTNTCPVALVNGSNGFSGGGSDTLFVGTVFLPGQEISFNSNQAMEDVGQVYCGYWAVQSGNHPNPVVTHDNNDTAFVKQTLRLVE